MARGQITEYDPGAFSPAATGVPQQDRSGLIIAQGIHTLGEALSKRADTVSNLSAMDSFGAFELERQQTKLKLQQQYSDNPMEYPAAANKAALDLSDKMSRGMSGEVAQKFRQMVSSTLASDADNLAKWSYARDSEIQVGKITSIKQNIALGASMVDSADGLRGIKQKFDDASIEARKLIDKESDDKLTLAHWDLAKKQAMSAQVFSQPMKVYRDLEGGAYNGVLDADEILTWKNKARDAIWNRAEDEQYRSLFMAQGKLLDFQNGLEKGTVNIADLINEREAVRAQRNKVDALGKPLIDPNYEKSLDSLIDSVLYANLRLPANKEARTVALKQFDTDWDQYLTEKKAVGGPTESDISKELEMYANLSSLYHNGTITKADFDLKTSIMRTKLALRQGQTPKVKSFSEVVDQAGSVPNLWWRKPGNDVVSLGYQMIKDHIDKAYPELDAEGRRDLKAQMLSQYHSMIQATPDEVIKKLNGSTENDRRNFARQKVLGMTTPKGEHLPGVISTNASYTDQGTQRTYQVGDTYSQFGATKIFAGRDPETGAAQWKLPEGELGKTVVIKNRRYKISGLNAQGDFMLKEVQEVK